MVVLVLAAAAAALLLASSPGAGFLLVSILELLRVCASKEGASDAFPTEPLKTEGWEGRALFDPSGFLTEEREMDMEYTKKKKKTHALTVRLRCGKLMVNNGQKKDRCG